MLIESLNSFQCIEIKRKHLQRINEDDLLNYTVYVHNIFSTWWYEYKFYS